MPRRKATLPDLDEPEDDETGPLRRCLVTRAQAPRAEMLRFVVGPGENLVFDVGATLPGRGFWLSAGPDVIHQAIKRGVFARAAKRSVIVPPTLPETIQTALKQRIFDSCALARRSGAAISGFEKAREWLVSGKAALVLQAADGSVEERARFLGARTVPVVSVLNGADLGRIFGREQTVHAVIAAGRLAQKIEIDAARLRGVAGGGVHGQ